MGPNVSHLLSKIAIAHRNASEEALAKAGLHAGQANVLFCLWESDGLSQAEITRALGVAPPTVNVLVSKLEEHGFVEARQCPNDGRLRRIHLTDKGRSKREDAERIVSELDSSILSGLTAIERNTAVLILDRIARNLCRGERDGIS